MLIYIRNFAFVGLISMCLLGCAHKPTYTKMTIACDAEGHPVFVTER